MILFLVFLSLLMVIARTRYLLVEIGKERDASEVGFQTRGVGKFIHSI